MKLYIITLKEEDLLDSLLKKLSNNQYKNISVFDSMSIASEKGKKSKNKTANIFGSLRYMLDFYNDVSKMIFVLCKEEELSKLKELVKETIPIDEYYAMAISISDIEGKID